MPKYYRIKKTVGYVTVDLEKLSYADYLKHYPEGNQEKYQKLTGKKVKKSELPKVEKVEKPDKQDEPKK